MTERERLIDILASADKSALGADESMWKDIIADYLLDNGVIVPPCKMGDTIYEICECRKGGEWQKVIKERVVHTIEIGVNNYISAGCGTTISVFLSDLGKTVFLTREEAEKALKERESE